MVHMVSDFLIVRQRDIVPLSKRAAADVRSQGDSVFLKGFGKVKFEVVEVKELPDGVYYKVKPVDAIYGIPAAMVEEERHSKIAKLKSTLPIVTLFHHLHHDKDKEKLEHEVHHCGGDHPNSSYTVKHCKHGKHAIDKKEAVGHAWASKDLKPFEVVVVFSEPCEKGWWHIESGKRKGKGK